jgi:tripartite-type tricarboxylate transporter receptor subunit TctC
MYTRYLFLLLSLCVASASAQDYPTKPIQIVVPSVAGGNIDALARLLAHHLSVELKQQVLVINRPGASMIPGTQAVAAAAPDGYRLLVASSTALAMNPVLFSKLPYDPLTSLSPVSMIAIQPMIIIVHPSVPAKSLAELVALAKAKPGSLFYGATGSSIQLAVEYFNSQAGIRMVPVNYKGNAEGLIDLVAGRIQVLFDVMTTSYPFVQSGKARALAITSKARSPAAPEIPTVAELGLPAGFEMNLFFALLAPPGTPDAIVERLNREVAKILALPDVRDNFAKYGVDARPSTAPELREHMRSEIARWKKVAVESNIEPQN